MSLINLKQILWMSLLLSLTACQIVLPSKEGKVPESLRPCLPGLNCVSSLNSMPPIPFAGSQDAGRQWILQNLQGSGDYQLERAEGPYLWLTYRSKFFRFVDDVEFLVDTNTQQIHYKSASRLGISDFGVNSKRIRKILANLEQHPFDESTGPNPD